MGYRTNCYGRGLALHGDKTTTGATLCSTLPNCTEFSRAIVRIGDRTTACKQCGKTGIVAEGEPRSVWQGVPAAVDGAAVTCGCPPGTNRIVAPAGQWLGQGRDPAVIAREAQAAALAARHRAEEQRREDARERNRVFAKSCLRGEGCNDAGDAREPHGNFAAMAFYQAVPAPEPEVVQHAQAARKNKPADDTPPPRKRSALYRWWFGNHEEMDYLAAKGAAERAERVKTAVADASVLGLIGGSAITSGTWAVKLGEVASGLGRIAASGPGAPAAAVLVGMMPGRLNDGEQDFIDRMRLEQMREAPTRVRFTWESDNRGNSVPHGWHTPPGKDRVRVRKMAWDSSRNAYTFTTEETPQITIIWTPDSTGENVPWNTGNQNPVRLPNPVMVDPLPENTGITATTTPVPEEKTFADYILILPLSNIPPIYVYLNSVLKGKDAAQAAKKLGYDRRVAPNKTPFNSHGQPAFFNGVDYITPDVDGHNVTEGWKKISKKGVRLGTYDKNLHRIKG
ncbi:S-type pyocin domain-containing protein [uncultured Pluralibacter sp.]|uniref:S-type pyocin domain-containing protein n=1 Tax=uncultured Pluralibacter sp. TaxID=1490864 RepID=UPI00261DB375|nr:S-type pyocin domain-containing protein [uncultured Pluralibacter sp.]